MFVDHARIEVRAGRGGDGKISFRREKFEPRGGPDGGDGGKGGSVLLKAVVHRSTLSQIAQRSIYRAEDGRPGRGKKQSGRSAPDLVLEVPLGTLVHDVKTGEVVADLTESGQEFVLARGGKGGLGNVHFATSTNQVPRVATHGAPGKTGRFSLELKLIADVGLVGLPNAGKSTLLRRVSRARPKVAAYPFTTLKPHLGVVELGVDKELVIADLPGLIEGASEGVGLGTEFLRHVERTRVLLHLVDGTGGPELGTPSPIEAYRTIRKEIASYDDELAKKPEVVALNKVDALPRDVAERVRGELETECGGRVALVSGVSGEGVDALVRELARRVETLARERAEEEERVAAAARAEERTSSAPKKTEATAPAKKKSRS